MGVFGAFFGCIGVVGFNGCCSGVRCGDGGFTLVCISGRCCYGGFTVAMCLCPVREKVRPARPDVCVSAKEFALRAHNGPKSAVCGVLGEFSRGNAAGGAVQGELFRDPAAV